MTLLSAIAMNSLIWSHECWSFHVKWRIHDVLTSAQIKFHNRSHSQKYREGCISYPRLKNSIISNSKYTFLIHINLSIDLPAGASFHCIFSPLNLNADWDFLGTFLQMLHFYFYFHKVHNCHFNLLIVAWSLRHDITQIVCILFTRENLQTTGETAIKRDIQMTYYI